VGGQEAYDRGRNLFEQGRWSAAADEFARVNDGVRGSIWMSARLLRGVSLTRAGRPAEAIDPLQEGLRLDPEWPDGHNALAMALGKVERFEEANVHLVQAARLGHPQAVVTMKKLGLEYCRSCHRPVYRTSPAWAVDLHYLTLKVGVQCEDCQETFCGHCLGGADIVVPPCPLCDGHLEPIELGGS
jgi:hypothetical protein